jgi:hypothetical protein
MPRSSKTSPDGSFGASLGTFGGDFHDGDDINPGNPITAKLAFDVPPDPNLTAGVLTLHDSMFSGGAKVSLDH